MVTDSQKPEFLWGQLKFVIARTRFCDSYDRPLHSQGKMHDALTKIPPNCPRWFANMMVLHIKNICFIYFADPPKLIA